MVSGAEILLSILILMLAWIRVSKANNETAFEFEQRLLNHYGHGANTKAIRSDHNDDIAIKINHVFFQESTDLSYLIRRTFWPWQQIDGNAIFDIHTAGFIIEDIDEFDETLGEDTSIKECYHEGHDNHYTLTIKGVPDDLYYRMQSFDVYFYYMANAQLTEEYHHRQGSK